MIFCIIAVISAATQKKKKKIKFGLWEGIPFFAIQLHFAPQFYE